MMSEKISWLTNNKDIKNGKLKVTCNLNAIVIKQETNFDPKIVDPMLSWYFTIKKELPTSQSFGKIVIHDEWHNIKENLKKNHNLFFYYLKGWGIN